MIWTLFKKECRMLWKSLIFWLYILAVALFFFSQMGTITFEPKPQPEQEGSYGMKLSDKPEDQIQGALTAAIPRCFRQCFDRFIKSPPGMGPASGNLQVFPFVFNRVIDLVSVRDAYAFEILQELSWMAGILRLLVFIQDNLAVCIHSSGAVYPHVAFASGRTAIFIYQDWRFICLQKRAA